MTTPHHQRWGVFFIKRAGRHLDNFNFIANLLPLKINSKPVWGYDIIESRRNHGKPQRNTPV